MAMASSFLLPGVRRAVPKLSRSFFACHKCPQKLSPQPAIDAVRKTLENPSINATYMISRGFKSTTSHLAAASTTSSLPSLRAPGTQNIVQRAIKATEAAKGATGFFPEQNSKTVGYWLLGSAASVFGLVVFGGLTRLTESGLSITEWRPVTGSLPPLSADDWESEFNKYRASPEFQLLNQHMTLEEFKKIYYMEWGHRLWGRFVGLSFVLPAIYFVTRKRVTAKMSLRLLAISGLIGFQGVLGWWMVKSGLKDDLFAPGSHPRVSQYRLTAHLGAAFVCYTAMFWNGLHILQEGTEGTNYFERYSRLKSPTLSVFRKSVAGLAVLVFLTAMSGGLVAGLDAGLIYNEFPYMGEGLTPPKSELFSSFYSRKESGSDIWWRNMLENPATVQLDHRILATTTFTAILSLWAYTRFSRRVRLPKHVQRILLGVVGLVFMQATLGISTLIYLVPTPLASAHQAGSLALLSGVMFLGSRVWVPRHALKGITTAISKGSVNPGKSALPLKAKQNPTKLATAPSGRPVKPQTDALNSSSPQKPLKKRTG